MSPVLSVLLSSLPNQPAYLAWPYTRANAHAQAHAHAGPSKHNIIGQRFEITASPSGEIVFLLAAVN